MPDFVRGESLFFARCHLPDKKLLFRAVFRYGASRMAVKCICLIFEKLHDILTSEMH